MHICIYAYVKQTYIHIHIYICVYVSCDLQDFKILQIFNGLILSLSFVCKSNYIVKSPDCFTTYESWEISCYRERKVGRDIYFICKPMAWVYIYIHIYMILHIYIYVYIYIDIDRCVCVYVYVVYFLHMYININIFKYVYVCAYVCTYVPT